MGSCILFETCVISFITNVGFLFLLFLPSHVLLMTHGLFYLTCFDQYYRLLSTKYPSWTQICYHLFPVLLPTSSTQEVFLWCLAYIKYWHCNLKLCQFFIVGRCFSLSSSMIGSVTQKMSQVSTVLMPEATCSDGQMHQYLLRFTDVSAP